MLRLAFDFIITWRETRTRPNAYLQTAIPGTVVPFLPKTMPPSLRNVRGKTFGREVNGILQFT